MIESLSGIEISAGMEFEMKRKKLWGAVYKMRLRKEKVSKKGKLRS